MNNSPALLGFIALCSIVLVLDTILSGKVVNSMFSVYRSSFTDPLTYFRLFGHVAGHSNFSHYFGNITSLLITGPMLEEKYGSKGLIQIILLVAFVTGLLNFIFFPRVSLRGASGVVFAFIVLASITGSQKGTIPVTLLIVMALYLSKEVFQGLTVNDNVSNITHIIGGLVGAFYGLFLT